MPKTLVRLNNVKLKVETLLGIATLLQFYREVLFCVYYVVIDEYSGSDAHQSSTTPKRVADADGGANKKRLHSKSSSVAQRAVDQMNGRTEEPETSAKNMDQTATSSAVSVAPNVQSHTVSNNDAVLSEFSLTTSPITEVEQPTGVATTIAHTIPVDSGDYNTLGHNSQYHLAQQWPTQQYYTTTQPIYSSCANPQVYGAQMPGAQTYTGAHTYNRDHQLTHHVSQHVTLPMDEVQKYPGLIKFARPGVQ